MERNRKNGQKGGHPKNPNNPMGSKKAEKENDKENENIELIYNSYPTRCIVGGRKTGKSGKCKDKIKTLLKTLSSEKLIESVKWYVDDCKKTNTFMKNFTTFLNNIPEIPEEYKPSYSYVKPNPNELQ